LVEWKLPKLQVVGSNPIYRSKKNAGKPSFFRRFHGRIDNIYRRHIATNVITATQAFMITLVFQSLMFTLRSS
jgi:hypothetical protein